jgi:hypothetical protein
MASGIGPIGGIGPTSRFHSSGPIGPMPGTLSAQNCGQNLAPIPMVQGGLTRLAIARLKRAGVPVASLLDRLRGIAREEIATFLGRRNAIAPPSRQDVDQPEGL